MDEPRRSHFLAQRGYLRHFAIAGRPGQIFLYQRGGTPVPTNIANVGLEKDLYAFKDPSGRLNCDIERNIFSRLDTFISPVLQRLNAERGEVTLTRAEAETLLVFTAFQFVRTPVFRDRWHTLGLEIIAEVSDLKGKELRDFLNQIGIDHPSDNVEDFWRALIEDAVKPSYSAEQWLRKMPRLSRRILDLIAVKSPLLLRANDEYFVTCDHPIVMDYQVGLPDAELLFPIGSHAVLYFRTLPKLDLGSTLTVPSRKISGDLARKINKRILFAADRFAYAAINRDGLRRLFHRTPVMKASFDNTPFGTSAGPS
ncbi:MAG: DUF4238 domain-containing protein [Candidatus Binataceae bacterium]